MNSNPSTYGVVTVGAKSYLLPVLDVSDRVRGYRVVMRASGAGCAIDIPASATGHVLGVRNFQEQLIFERVADLPYRVKTYSGDSCRKPAQQKKASSRKLMQFAKCGTRKPPFSDMFRQNNFDTSLPMTDNLQKPLDALGTVNRKCSKPWRALVKAMKLILLHRQRQCQNLICK